MNRLTPRQAIFVKKITQGLNQTDSAKLAGYSPKTAYVEGSRQLKNAKVLKALDAVGLTDTALAKHLKKNIEAGSGIKATADTTLRGVELAYRLKGSLDRPETVNNTQNNVSIELRNASEEDINAKLDALLEEVEELKT